MRPRHEVRRVAGPAGLPKDGDGYVQHASLANGEGKAREAAIRGYAKGVIARALHVEAAGPRGGKVLIGDSRHERGPDLAVIGGPRPHVD